VKKDKKKTVEEVRNSIGARGLKSLNELIDGLIGEYQGSLERCDADTFQILQGAIGNCRRLKKILTKGTQKNS
jgi:hypothetical protein